MSDRDAGPWATGEAAAADDAFATSAGAYVLGALSPVERAAFEGHLRTCRACEADVADIAGLPGLLGRVPLEMVETLDEPAAAPPDLMPGLLSAVRRRRRRARALTASACGLAAACALGLVVALGTGAGRGDTAAPVAAPSVPSATMTQLIGGLPITAKASLTSVPWGTKIHMNCFYASATNGEPWPYVLVAIDAAGHAQQVASWTALPGRDADVWGSTSLQRSDIRELEVRTTAGAPILRLMV